MDLKDFKSIESLYQRYRFMSQEALLDEVVEITYKFQKLLDAVEDFDRASYSDAMFKIKRGLDESTPISFKDKCVAVWEKIFTKKATDYIRNGMLQTGIYESKKITLWERFLRLFKKNDVVYPKEQYTAQEMKKVSADIKQALLK